MKHLFLILAVIVVILVVIYQLSPTAFANIEFIDAIVDSSITAPLLVAAVAILAWFYLL